MQRASIVMGHLARCGNELTRDFVDFEVRRALEALSATPRSEPRRLAAAFVLRELAKSVPSLFFEHAPAFLKVRALNPHPLPTLIILTLSLSLSQCLSDYLSDCLSISLSISRARSLSL